MKKLTCVKNKKILPPFRKIAQKLDLTNMDWSNWNRPIEIYQGIGLVPDSQILIQQRGALFRNGGSNFVLPHLVKQ